MATPGGQPAESLPFSSGSERRADHRTDTLRQIRGGSWRSRPSGPDDPGPCRCRSDGRSVDHSAELARGGRGRGHKDLQRSVGWQWIDPGTEAPSARAASTSPEADERARRKPLRILRDSVGSTVQAMAANSAIGKSDAEPHHAHRSTVDSRLNVLPSRGVQQEDHVDPETIRKHIQGWDDPDGVISLVEQRIDCQGGGQGTF